MGKINRAIGSFQAGETAKAEEVNAELDVIHNLVNGNIENSNISDNSIDLSLKGEGQSITNGLFQQDVITLDEIVDNVRDTIEDDARVKTNGIKVELRNSNDGDVDANQTNAGRIYLRTDL